MTQFSFHEAKRESRKLRAFLAGVSGSGKTWTALTIANELGSKIALIDTEKSSASLYADDFKFSALSLDVQSIENLESCMKSAAESGFDVVIIDSFSHFWNGTGGILDEIDAWTRRDKSHNSYRAWGAIGNDLVKRMINAVLDYPGHVICTARSKKKYIVGEDEKTGKQKIEKGTLEPQVREGIEFEFDVVWEIDLDHTMIVEKTRCRAIDGKVWRKPKSGDFQELLDWLNSGAPQSPPTKSETTSSSTPSPELAVDEPEPQDIDKVAGAIIAEYGLSKDALLVWVPRDLDAVQRYARLTRIQNLLSEGIGKMSACALGAYHDSLYGVDLASVFTGKPENEVAEHTALCKAINLRANAENPQPLIEYIKAQFESKAA